MKQRLFVFIGMSILVVSCGKSYSGRYAGNETLTLTQSTQSYSGYNPYQQPGATPTAAAPTTATALITLQLPEADSNGNITGGQWTSTGAGNQRTGTFSGHANGSGFDNVIMVETNPQPIPTGAYSSYGTSSYGSSGIPSVNYIGSLSYNNNHITGSLALQNPQQYPSLASTLSIDAVKQQ